MPEDFQFPSEQLTHVVCRRRRRRVDAATNQSSGQRRRGGLIFHLRRPHAVVDASPIFPGDAKDDARVAPYGHKI
jgi:hypothetical protein